MVRTIDKEFKEYLEKKKKEKKERKKWTLDIGTHSGIFAKS